MNQMNNAPARGWGAEFPDKNFYPRPYAATVENHEGKFAQVLGGEGRNRTDA